VQPLPQEEQHDQPSGVRMASEPSLAGRAPHVILSLIYVLLISDLPRLTLGRQARNRLAETVSPWMRRSRKNASSGELAAGLQPVSRTSDSMPDVVITRNVPDIGAAIEGALGGIALEPIVAGRVVAVKPNDTWASHTDTTGVTQPDTLGAILRVIKRYGPRQLIVSGGAGAAETEEVFRLGGLMEIVEAEGAAFFDHNRPPFVSVDLEYAPERDVRGPQRAVMVNPRVLEYETLIAVNQLKLHETATVTLALKNIAMSFPAADYYGHPRSTEEHEHRFFDDMHSFIAAMAKRFPIALAITVGHPAMIATGPLGGHAVETGLVIASTDPLAADVVAARLLGFKLQAVRHLWEAARLGIGETNFKRMRFPMLSLQDAIEAFTLAAYGERLTFQHE